MAALTAPGIRCIQGREEKIIEQHSVQEKKNNNHHFTAQSGTSAAAAGERRHPPTSVAIYTSTCSVQPIPSLCFFLRTLRLPLPSLAQASLLFWAQSDVFCSHNPSITHLLFTLHCLPPLLQPISGPACQLSPCCQRIAASDSINCFCKRSAAAVVSIPPAASIPSILFPSSLSDVKTKSGSKFLIYQDALQLMTPTVRPGSCSSGRDGV